jgi:hypothetical protein
MARPKKPTLSSDEINALKALAALAPTLVKQLSEPKVSKGGQNIPEEGELENRPPAPQGSGGKQKKKGRRVKDEDDGGHVRVGKSTKLRGQGRKGTQARREPMAIGRRPNLFEKMKEFNAHKDDVKIDKALWKGVSVQERGDRTTAEELECCECGDSFVAAVSQLKKRESDDGTTEYVFTCNDCELGKR